MEIEKEVLKLTQEINTANCFGCTNKCFSQKDHNCFIEFYYNLSLFKALEKLQFKYNNTLNTDELYEKLKLFEF